ncbi:hypothetical protein [Acanthopleuribacter pedis]|uniref:Uncharacterized protein n=1 Tax=Acanthopleuribacter pedis TaxID=442870 RepID=A0A8J7QFV0_9BACT|nr:hypothetical protein [Acanthopleuribacter pedis]MBO1319205.1 hypothetical protein [Acanthopleuribacter pedis]
MLGTPTYHRYPPPAQMPRMRKTRKPAGTATTGATERTTPNPAATKTTPSRATTNGGFSHAEDLVARLNARLAPYNTALYFEAGGAQQSPLIDMKQQADQQLVRRFAAQDMLELERGVFELSGFHLSLTA